MKISTILRSALKSGPFHLLDFLGGHVYSYVSHEMSFNSYSYVHLQTYLSLHPHQSRSHDQRECTDIYTSECLWPPDHSQSLPMIRFARSLCGDIWLFYGVYLARDLSYDGKMDIQDRAHQRDSTHGPIP